MDTSQLAELADEYFLLRQERLEEQKYVDKLEEKEKKLKQYLMDAFLETKSTAIGGRLVEISVVEKVEPTVENYDALYKHVQATGEFDLLYRRVNAAAVKERWQLHEKVPGVVGFPVQSLSMHARK
jgi:hypothetical protein